MNGHFIKLTCVELQSTGAGEKLRVTYKHTNVLMSHSSEAVSQRVWVCVKCLFWDRDKPPRTCSSAPVCTNRDELSFPACLCPPFLSVTPSCEEGPNFSLISFIKRCREKRRKRRIRNGEWGEKRLGGQIGEWWIGRWSADCTIKAIKRGE